MPFFKVLFLTVLFVEVLSVHLRDSHDNSTVLAILKRASLVSYTFFKSCPGCLPFDAFLSGLMESQGYVQLLYFGPRPEPE
jgi:hypothetical protein